MVRLRDGGRVVAADQRTPRPENVSTKAELGEALKALKGARSYKELDRAANGLPGAPRLPAGTLTGLFRGEAHRSTLETFLAVCEVTGAEQTPWIDAWLRSRGVLGSVRVRLEGAGVEAAPNATAQIEDWLARRERECLGASDSTMGPAEELTQFVGTAAGMIAEAARLVGGLPTDVRGRVDPAKFAEFGVKAVGLSLQRFGRIQALQKKTMRSGTPSHPDKGEQVAEYLRISRRVLRGRLGVMVARWPGCSVQVRLANPGDQDIVGATVLLAMPEGVKLIDPSVADIPPPGMPPPPTGPGSTVTSGFTLFDVYNEDFGLWTTFGESIVERRDESGGPTVDADTGTVEFRGIRLPGRDSVLLPAFPVMVDGASGTALTVRWTVTGSAEQQRYSGSLAVPVVASTLPLDGLFPT
jgi:hypothetical protein